MAYLFLFVGLAGMLDKEISTITVHELAQAVVHIKDYPDDEDKPFSDILIQRMSSFLNGPKTIVESKTIVLYMCRGNRIHILNCKKTTTKGGR